jgi:hypothetical protein
MFRKILFKTLSVAAITAAALSLLVVNPTSPSGFSDAQAFDACADYQNCMYSCIPACRAWYGPNITLEECISVCEAWYCGAAPPGCPNPWL